MDARSSLPPLLRCNNDVLYAICKEVWGLPRRAWPQNYNARAFAETCKHVRQLMAPHLYERIVVYNGGDWSDPSSAIESIAECEAARQYTKNLTMDLCVSHFRETQAPQQLPIKLARMLVSLIELEKLTFAVPMCQIELFRLAFKTAEIAFPSIRTLILGPSMDWVIPMCPSVRTICTDKARWTHCLADKDTIKQCTFDLIKAAGLVNDVQHFEIMATNSAQVVEALLTSIPNVTSLAVVGGVDSVDGIIGLAPLYACFIHLHTLVLASVERLGVGYELPKWPTGFTQNAEERFIAEKKVGNVIFEACTNLEILWMGDRTRVTCERDGKGKVVHVDVDTVRRKKITD